MKEVKIILFGALLSFYFGSTYGIEIILGTIKNSTNETLIIKRPDQTLLTELKPNEEKNILEIIQLIPKIAFSAGPHRNQSEIYSIYNKDKLLGQYLASCTFRVNRKPTRRTPFISEFIVDLLIGIPDLKNTNTLETIKQNLSPNTTSLIQLNINLQHDSNKLFSASKVTAFELKDEKFFSEKNTLLLNAARAGNSDAILKFASRGADVNSRDPKSFTTPLMWASTTDLESVVVLIAYGADANAKDINGATALMFASRDGQLDIVKYLIKVVAKIHEKDKQNKTALDYARENNRTAIVDYLSSTLSESEKIKLILDAARVGNVNLLKFAIEKGINVKSRDPQNFTTPLMWASSAGGNLEAVKLLIEHGANVNARDINNGTSLMFASRDGKLDIVKYLIEKGANINDKDKQNKTALDYARENNRTDIVNYLTQHGAKTK